MPAAPVLDQLVTKLRAALDSALVSVILHGSAASGDSNGRFSDLNILCVLKEISPAQLRAVEPVLRWWRSQGNPSPLLLTETELRTSTDCFPVEFHDIKARHRILFGPDPVSDLEISNDFYRAQVEHDLRAKLMRLRQKASAILSDKDALRRLLIDSVSTFCVLLRHALALSGVSATAGKRDTVGRAAAAFGIDPKPFEQLLDLREEKVKPGGVEPEALLTAYMSQIEKAIAAVDRMEARVRGSGV
jgi:hypothetical protein